MPDRAREQRAGLRALLGAEPLPVHHEHAMHDHVIVDRPIQQTNQTPLPRGVGRAGEHAIELGVPREQLVRRLRVPDDRAQRQPRDRERDAYSKYHVSR